MSNTAEGIRKSATTIKGIHHIGISVTDVSASLDFFKGAAHLDEQAMSSFSGKGLAASEPQATAIVKGPNAFLELMQFDTATPNVIPVEGPGFTHICFQSPAEQTMYNKFTSEGAKAVSWGDGPVDLGGYGVHYAYLRDHDDTMYEVEQIDHPKFEGQVWIAHVALVSHDIDALMAFYSAIFDIEPYRRVNKVVGPRVDEVTGLKDARSRAGWFNIGNMVFEIWEYISPVTPKKTVHSSFETIGYNKFTFEVSNLEIEVSRLKNLGVEFTHEIIKTPIGREIYAKDPDGNRFSLLELDDNELSIDNLKGISWKTA
jgi:catechol 2,3-dioxygenase-like lactoylglutathione lyase family enzyme